MRFAFALVFAFLLLNSAFALQFLSKGYFLYNNITVGNGQSVYVGINSSTNVNLMVIKSSSFSSYINGSKITALYNKSLSTGVYQLNLGVGNFTVISTATKTTNLDTGVVVVPSNIGTIVNLNGKYYYNFTLSNYSNVQINLLSSSDYSLSPMMVNVSTTSTVIRASTNLDTISLSLNRGPHSLILNSPSKQQVFISINSTPALVNPLTQINNGGNYSQGISSYGLYNISGKLYPYRILTNEVVGVANITALSSYEANPAPQSSKYGASLQLNVGLNTYINNKSRVLWLQDVLTFNTSSKRYYFVDNVWNNTGPYANLTRGAVLGSGNFLLCNSCENQSFYVYSYPQYYLNYSFPFDVRLLVIENQTLRGTQINFGYQILRNGASQLGPLIFYDHVLLPGSSNSTLITTPYYLTPGGSGLFGNYYDTELVFGGESGGANANFQQMNASLWIYYNNKSVITPFPSVYTFGLSTAETATGITTKNVSGTADVQTGRPNRLLDLFAGNVLTQVAQYISQTSNYSNPSTTITPQNNYVNSNNISPSQINTLEIGAGLVIVIILVLGFMLLRRR